MRYSQTWFTWLVCDDRGKMFLVFVFQNEYSKMILLYLTPYVIFSLTRHKFAEIRTREFYAETRIAYTLVYTLFIPSLIFYRIIKI